MTKATKITIAPQGPQLSQLIQGYWRLDKWDMSPQTLNRFINDHLSMGISTVDLASIYGAQTPCEQLFGEALKLTPELRDNLQIISKFGITRAQGNKVGHYDCSASNIKAQVDTSLNRLGVESLDVLLVHRPDYLMDADEVAETFNQLHHSGKVKHFGVSNFTHSQFNLLQSRLSKPLVTNQIEINPFNMQSLDDGVLDQLQQYGVRPMAWSCMAGGRIFNDTSEQAIRLRDVLAQLKEELGASSIEQVVYAWIMRLPSKPLPIIGSGRIERVSLAVSSLKLSMNSEQWYRIWVAAKGHGVP